MLIVTVTVCTQNCGTVLDDMRKIMLLAVLTRAMSVILSVRCDVNVR